MKRASLQRVIAVSVFAIVAFFALKSVAFAAGENAVAYITDPVQTTFNSFIESIMFTVLTVMSKVLWLAGTLFNVAITESLKISDFVNQIGSVEVVWKTIRDFTSIFFIFVLLYTSIKHILGDSGADTKRVIVNLIMAGLLINFSMFITKTLIDGSNIVAKGFYDAITVNQQTKITATTAGAAFAQNLNNTDGGISQIFMQSMKLSTLYDAKGLSTVGSVNRSQQNLGVTTTSIVLVGVFGSVLMLVAAFVFFAGAAMFIIRIAILVLLIALSPVAFIGKVLPQTDKYSKKWWGTLIDQCTFAPVYLAMTYLGLKILTAPGFAANVYTQGDTFTAAITASAAPKIFLNFALVIIFFMAALAVANEFGGVAAKYGNEFGKLGKKLAGAAAGFAGRQTLGRFGTYAEEKLTEGDGPISGRIAKFSNSVIGSSIRSATTGALADSKYFSDSNFAAQEKARKDREAKGKEIGKRMEVAAAIKAGSAVGASQEAKDKLELTVGKLGNKELEQAGKDRYADPAVAVNLSDSQLEYLMKSETVKQKDKDAILDARFKQVKEKADAVEAAAKAGGTAERDARGQLRDALKNISEKDLKYFGYDRLKGASAVVEELSPSSMSALMKNADNYTENQKAQLKAIRSAPLMNAIKNKDTAKIKSIISGIKKPEDVAKLPAEFLKDPLVVAELKPSHLKEIQKENYSLVADIAPQIQEGHSAWDFVLGEGKDTWGLGREKRDERRTNFGGYGPEDLTY